MGMPNSYHTNHLGFRQYYDDEGKEVCPLCESPYENTGKGSICPKCVDIHDLEHTDERNSH